MSHSGGYLPYFQAPDTSFAIYLDNYNCNRDTGRPKPLPTPPRKHETRSHSDSQKLKKHCQVRVTVARIPVRNCHATTSSGYSRQILCPWNFRDMFNRGWLREALHGRLGRVYPRLLFQALVAPLHSRLDSFGTGNGRMSKLKESMTAMTEYRLHNPDVCRTCAYV